MFSISLVGRSGIHSEDQVVCNIISIINQIATNAKLMPGKFRNVKALYLKSHDSVALPIFNESISETYHNTNDANEHDKEKVSSGKKRKLSSTAAAEDEKNNSAKNVIHKSKKVKKEKQEVKKSNLKK